MTSDSTTSFGVLDSVQTRYAEGARTRVPELCCPVDYDADLLKKLPEEVVERDYGCGDPSRFVRPGDAVLDLGSGTGKICYMASQIVGREGRVIGVDTTPEMLALSRKWRREVGDRIGWHNVDFRHGHIQDLALDRDAMQAFLEEHPVRSLEDLERLREQESHLRSTAPMIPDGSIDIVLSNCVLNLVHNSDKRQLFREIARVLKPGGRCAISDIVSDEDVPEKLQRDPELWSGCISGAMREDQFLGAFAEAGLYGIQVDSWQEQPWAVVEGIEFRSLTAVAWKGLEGPSLDHREAVVYKGPWSRVCDDAGNEYRRGERTAVSRKTYEILAREPYAGQVLGIAPLEEVSSSEAELFGCKHAQRRDPRETKGGAVRENQAPAAQREPEGGCC